MSRTYRKKSFNKCALRNPKTFNEKKNIDFIITDKEVMEFGISGINRIKARRSSIPSHWDDIVTSSHYETDYND
jgi:hypothetical protein